MLDESLMESSEYDGVSIYSSDLDISDVEDR